MVRFNLNLEIQKAQSDMRLYGFDNFACARESLTGIRTAPIG
jgi:hypothetical protein